MSGDPGPAPRDCSLNGLGEVSQKFFSGSELTSFPLQIRIPTRTELECGGHVPGGQRSDNKLLSQAVARALRVAPASRSQEQQQQQYSERHGRGHACGRFRLPAASAPTKAGIQ